MTATLRMASVGDLSRGTTSRHRSDAFRRLGIEVLEFDTAPYAAAGGRLASALRIRMLADLVVPRLNADLVAFCRDVRPDLVWFDKPTFVWRSTLDRLRRLGILLVNYVIDNPYSTLRGEPGWRLIRKCIPHYDVNVVPRPSSVDDYRAAGASHVVLMPLAFDPMVHYPQAIGDPKAIGESSAARPAAEHRVCFIGSPYGDRPGLIRELGRRGLPVTVRGNRWAPYMATSGENVRFMPEAVEDEYRRAIWNADICLGLITHAHRDPVAHRSFEIAASGGFLLGERTEGQTATFAEDVEACFFGDVDEAAEKAAYYLEHATARHAIARAGAVRAWTSGYSNDERQAAALAAIDGRRVEDGSDVFDQIV